MTLLKASRLHLKLEFQLQAFAKGYVAEKLSVLPKSETALTDVDAKAPKYFLEGSGGGRLVLWPTWDSMGLRWLGMCWWSCYPRFVKQRMMNLINASVERHVCGLEQR